MLEKAPLFVLSGLMCLVTVLAQHAFSAVRSIETFPILLRITNAIVAYGTYLWLTIWPWNLSFYYPHPGEIEVVATLASLSILLLATGIAWFERRRRPWLGVGWLWYLGTLVPVIGLVQVGDQAMADRYTYIPLIGIFVALCYELVERARQVPRGPQVAGVALGLVGAACMALTVRQVSYWGTSERLTRHAPEVVGERVSLRHLLGQASPTRTITKVRFENIDAPSNSTPVTFWPGRTKPGRSESSAATPKRSRSAEPRSPWIRTTLRHAIYWLGPTHAPGASRRPSASFARW